MSKEKLQEKLFKRIGLTAISKVDAEKGIISSFVILDNPDGTYSVNYVVIFESEAKVMHESALVIMRKSQ